MTTIGAKLKESRERQNVSLDDISRTTKIRVGNLEAIERAAYDELPGEVFAKGYVRSFAEALGLDPAAMAAEYDEERRAAGAVEPEAVQREREEAARAALAALADGHHLRRRRIRLGWIGGSVAVVVLLAASIGWVLLRDDLSFSAKPVAPIEKTSAEGDAPDAPAAGEPVAETVDHVIKNAPAEPAASTGDELAVQPETPVAQAPVPERAVAESATAASPPASDPGARLSITEFGVGTGVENRTLVGRGDVFAAGGRCVFWTRVVGGRAGDEIHHRWLLDGEVVRTARLSIGGPHWRTHSAMRPEAAGDWVVEARDAQNRLLASAAFQVRD